METGIYAPAERPDDPPGKPRHGPTRQPDPYRQCTRPDVPEPGGDQGPAGQSVSAAGRRQGGSGKPFPYEDDLRVKSVRLVELDTLLNLDGRGRSQLESVIAKSARPSVLDSLKRQVPSRSPEKKPKQHEEVR